MPLLVLETMTVLLPIAATIFLLVSLGWWLSYAGMTEDQKQILNKIVAGYLIPVYLFSNALTADLAQMFSLALVLSYFLPALLMALCLTLVTKQLLAATILASHYSNTLYFALPVIALLLDAKAINYALSIIIFNTFFVLTIYAVVKRGVKQEVIGLLPFATIIINSVKNPIVASLYLGLLINLLFNGSFKVIEVAKDLVALPVLFLALLSLGVSLQSLPGNRASWSWLGIFNKLLLFPLTVLVCSYYLFELDSTVTSVLVILAASPLAINSYFFVGGDTEAELLVGRCIIQTSILSVISMPLWILVLNLL